jgi:hypothetical protein
MASEISQAARELAGHVTRVVYEATNGQPRRWRLSRSPGASADVIL